MTEATISERLAAWACGSPLSETPRDVIDATKMRVLDTLGLALIGRTFDVGRAALGSLPSGSETGAASVIGGPRRLPAASAAFANGVLAGAIEFDDSHNETVVHATTPVVGAALALAESAGRSGSEFLRAVSVGVEIACRAAVAAPGMLHPRGFHPTGIFGAFGAAAAGAALLGLDQRRFTSALGLSGSFASGILESWADGTWGKLAHPGWAAQSGVWAARLAAQDFSGPAAVFEGRKGLFATHVQGAAAAIDLDRIAAGLGAHWESRSISFKPYPNAHVMHGVQDALLALLDERPVEPRDVVRVTAFVAPYMVDLVCEPAAARKRPPSEAQARISLPHTLAEIIAFRAMDAGAYAPDRLASPEVRALADRFEYVVREDWTDRSAFPGGVRLELRDGSRVERFETANLGSAAKPMSRGDVEEKFARNAARVLPAANVARIVRLVDRLEDLRSVADLTAVTIA